jgi:hypothetical protein
VGGLAFAVSEFDRRHSSNGFARLGLAQPGFHLIAQDSQRKQTGCQRVTILGNDTERVSASFGNNFPPSGG